MPSFSDTSSSIVSPFLLPPTLHTATTFDNETNGVWTMADYDKDGVADLVYIKTSNTPNNLTEVHIASAASNFQTRILATATTFGSDPSGTWSLVDYDKDGVPDLVYIKTSNTPGNKVEIHIASGASNYQARILETQTVFDCASGSPQGTWLMADYDGDGKLDLIYIKTSNTPGNKVEVHVASAASNFQSFALQTQTAFTCDTGGKWTLADYTGDGKLDLIFIKTANTAGNKTEIHVASGSSNFQTRILDTPTTLGCDTNGTWLVCDRESVGVLDLVYIKTSNTPNKHVEVQVVSGGNGVDIERVAKRLAPVIKFHPDEQYFPCSVEWFLNRCQIVVGGASQNYADHSTNFQMSGFMQVGRAGPLTTDILFAATNTTQFGGGEIDAISLFPLPAAPNTQVSYSRKGYFTNYQWETLVGEPLIGRKTPAFCYVRITKTADYYLISYYFLCAYNGAMGPVMTKAQPMATLLNGGGYFAHIGDWMRVSARVSLSGRKVNLLGVEYEAHGTTTFNNDANHTFSQKTLAQIGALTAYSARHSHELYPSANDSWVLPDTALAKDSTADGGVQWNTGERLVILHDDIIEPSQKWIAYNGLWGANININYINVGIGIDTPWGHVGTSDTPIAMQKNGPSGPAFKAAWMVGQQYRPQNFACDAKPQQAAVGQYFDGQRLRKGDGVYLVLDSLACRIPDAATYNNIFRDTNGISDVGANVLNFGPALTSGAYLANDPRNGAVYLISNTQKRHVADPATMDKCGFDWNKIRPISAADCDATTTSRDINGVINYPEGLRIRTPGDGKIYLVFGGKPCHIPDWPTYQNLFRAAGGQIELAAVSNVGAPLVPGAYLGNCNGMIFFVSGNARYYVSSPAAMDRYFFDWNKVRALAQVDSNKLAAGPNLV